MVAELHAPIIINPLAPGEEPTSKQERGSLRVNTQLGHVNHRSSIAKSSTRLSPTPTSESDKDDIQRTRAGRSVASFPSFHLSQRARSTSLRKRRSETPPLTTSESHSSLTSSSVISQSSSLYTPPHSSPIAPSFVYTEITNPSPQLSAISELRNAEDHSDLISLHPYEAKSTQTLTRIDRPGPAALVHENEGGSATITPRTVPRALDTHANLANLPRTESPTGTVTGLLLTASSATLRHELPQVSATPHSPSQAASPGLSSLSNSSGLAWPFGGRLKGDAVTRKVQKAEEKRRKKEEARARKERLAEELKRRDKAQKADTVSMYSTRSNEAISKGKPWEEDIAMFGGLASM
jgi:hypothetical protein